MGFMLKTNGCCCCFDLRTGTLIILWLDLVGVIYNIVTDIIYERKEIHSGSVHVYLAFYYMFWFVYLVASGMGLYGVYQKRPSFLKVYVILNIFAIIFAIVVAVLCLLLFVFAAGFLTKSIEDVIRYQNGSKLKDPSEVQLAALGALLFVGFIFLCIFILMSWYFISVVHNYYLKMKEETNEHFVGYDAPKKGSSPAAF